MEFLLFIGVAVSLIYAFWLRSRVARIEELLKHGVQPAGMPSPVLPSSQTAQPSAPLQAPSPFAPQALQQMPYVPQAFHAEPDWYDRFIDWLKEEWLLKLGALLLLIGFGWLTTYAFMNNWIGPMGRIALGIVAGALFLILGWWRIQRFLHQGGIFLVLGSTTILLTIFAARMVYGFFTPLTALAVMFLSTAFVAVASVRYKSRTLAFASLALAGIAPLLTNAPTHDYVGLFGYLFVVVLGAIWIAVLTGHRELTAAGLILVGFYSLPHLFSFVSQDQATLLLFAYGFSALFFITNTAGMLKLKDKDIVPDTVTAAGNGLFLLIWIMAAAPDEWKSLIIAVWMLIFVIGAFIVFTTTGRREPFYVYASIAVAFLATATALELEGAALTIAYTLESALVSFVAYAALKNMRVAARTSLLLIGPVILSVQHIVSPAWTTGVLHEDFFALALLALTLLGLGALYAQALRETPEKNGSQLDGILLIGGSLYVFALIWLSLHAVLFDKDMAAMIALVIYTVVGLAAYFYGRSEGQSRVEVYGASLLGVVVLRLLMVDVWKMAVTGRIMTFFLIGTLLMSTAFLWRTRKSTDEAAFPPAP